MQFTLSHEWVHLEEDVATVGITAYAQKELGEVVYVQLPVVGKTVKCGEPAVVLESTKAAADIYSPVTGEILEVNEALQTNVNLLNISPEKEGWLFKISVQNAAELHGYLTKEDYRRLVEQS